MRTSVPASQPPTYPGQDAPNANINLQQRFTGSFRLAAGTRHLHRDCNFTELLVETALKSLRHSCRSELTRQGISLYSVTSQNPVARLGLTETTSQRIDHLCRPLYVAIQSGPYLAHQNWALAC